eukprot:gene1384-2759_t
METPEEAQKAIKCAYSLMVLAPDVIHLGTSRRALDRISFQGDKISVQLGRDGLDRRRVTGPSSADRCFECGGSGHWCALKLPHKMFAGQTSGVRLLPDWPPLPLSQGGWDYMKPSRITLLGGFHACIQVVLSPAVLPIPFPIQARAFQVPLRVSGQVQVQVQVQHSGQEGPETAATISQILLK